MVHNDFVNCSEFMLNTVQKVFFFFFFACLKDRAAAAFNKIVSGSATLITASKFIDSN